MLAVSLVVALVVAVPVLAEDTSLGTTLAQSIWCDMKSVFDGSVGLLVGFGVALLGLWQVVQGKGMAGVLLIAGGAAVSQLPALIESTLQGMGSALQAAGISHIEGQAARNTSCRAQVNTAPSGGTGLGGGNHVSGNDNGGTSTSPVQTSGGGDSSTAPATIAPSLIQLPVTNDVLSAETVERYAQEAIRQCIENGINSISRCQGAWNSYLFSRQDQGLSPQTYGPLVHGISTHWPQNSGYEGQSTGSGLYLRNLVQ